MLKRTAKPENAQPAAKRKLTRAERKQIEAIIRQAKGDGKPHTVQDSIPFRNLYPDGLWVINLDKESEPDIYGAITRDALLENVTAAKDGKIDFADKTVTENTRDRKSTRLNSSHCIVSRMPSSA